MAQRFNPATWTDGVTIPAKADFVAMAADIVSPLANVDGGRYGRANTGFVTLVPGVLPGPSFTVTAGSWSGGTATLTIGAHLFAAGQLITVASITPSGYNVAFVPITGVGGGGTTISYALTSNPGAWSSGGTVLAGGTPAASGMLAVDITDGKQKRYNGSSWDTIAIGSFVPLVTTPSSWAAASLANSWLNFGSGYNNAEYMIDGNGFVHIRGTIKSGTTTDGTTLFTLPAGFRPPANVAFAVSAGGGSASFAQIVIAASGTVQVYSAAGNTFLHLFACFSTQ